MSDTRRRTDLDLLKFFAIATVLVGHSVEQTTGNDFWTNPLWSFIYSFHMPLFMMLCGYFFGSSLRRPFAEMLRRKSVQLLLPSVTFTVLIYGMIALTGFNPVPEMFGSDFTSVANVLWFLKCVFLCYVIAYVSLRITGNVAVAAVTTSVLFMLLPGGDFVNFNFLLPVFWAGYALSLGSESVSRNRKPLLLVSAAAFIAMLFFWSGTLTVYAVPIAVVDWPTMTLDPVNLGITLYRLAIGLSGSILMFLLARPVDRMLAATRIYRPMLTAGKATLGIYAVQTIVVEAGIHVAGLWLTTVQSLLIAPLIAAVGFAVCYACVCVLRFHPLARLLFLGETAAPAPRLDVR